RRVRGAAAAFARRSRAHAARRTAAGSSGPPAGRPGAAQGRERRAAGVGAAACKASAGALARVPVARATNVVRALRDYQAAGLFVVGLTAEGVVDVHDLEVGDGPVVLVIGSEGRGLSRLVTQTCDLTARIPMSRGTDSLNAAVAAGIALAEVARRRAQIPSS
ncbi:MAG: TrmH family RNA methyltransferase, partial [Frankiaceae bacterium]